MVAATPEVKAIKVPGLEDRHLPWAGLVTGHANEGEKLTSTQLLKRAGLDWDVELQPLFRRKKTGEDVVYPGVKEVVRTDIDEPLGIVKSHYPAFSNRDAFAFGDEIISEGNGSWSDAGEQWGGIRVFMTMALEPVKILKNEEYSPVLFIRTGHDGGASISVTVIPFRTRSLTHTGLVLKTRKSTLSIPHTSTLRGRIEEAHESIKLASGYLTAFEECMDQLAKVEMSDKRATLAVESIVPETRSRREAMIQEILDVYHSSPTVEGYRGTGYGLLLGVCEYFDHAKPQRSDTARFESIMLGEGFRARNKLADRLARLSSH